MNEAVEQVTRKSALDETHARLGATMIERDGWSVPGSFGDVSSEYAAVREGGAGVIDLSSRGRLLVSGTEAVQFLNGLITNDMKTLAEDSWMPAAFPNVQGRLIASVRVIRLQDEGTEKTGGTGQTTPVGLPRRGPQSNAGPTFLIDTEATTHAPVLKTIERFTLAGDFRVRDVTSETAMLSVQGKKAAALVHTVLGEAAGALAPYRVTRIAWPPGDKEVADGEANDTYDGFTDGVIVMRATHTAEDGFDLVVNAAQAPSLWEALQTAGARPFGYEALRILRIEAGSPRFGVDMDDTNVVTEALDDAVSYTKGCYVGQEIIARIKYRGHVAKKLSGIAFAQAVKVPVGAAIKSADGKEIGRLTSVTDSPQLGRTIALGYLKYDYLATGTSVKISADDQELPAQVTELPFVRGSWYEETPAAD
jgi:folate-binding protein YgfZ